MTISSLRLAGTVVIACIALAAFAVAGEPAVPAAVPARRPARLSPLEFKRRLVGPIMSIATPFAADLQVDHAAVTRMIRRALVEADEDVVLEAGFFHKGWTIYGLGDYALSST